MQNDAVRIAMFHEGRRIPRLPWTPLLSSAGMDWKHFVLEHHRLLPAGRLSGTIDGYQVYLPLTGPVVMNWRMDGRDLSKEIGPRDLCTATHGEFNSISWDRPFDSLLFCISPKFMADLSAEKNGGKTVELIKHRGLRDPNIENILRLLRAEVAAGGLHGPAFAEHLGMALAVYLFERHTVAQPKKPEFLSRLPGKTLHNVLAYIDERIAAPITVEELAAFAGLSRFYFARLFRNALGVTPCQCILDKRMGRAKLLLENRKMSVCEIAYACGFSAQSHFASVFRARTGLTPSRYRSMLG